MISQMMVVFMILLIMDDGMKGNCEAIPAQVYIPKHPYLHMKMK